MAGERKEGLYRERERQMAGHSSLRVAHILIGQQSKKHGVWAVGPRAQPHVRSRDSRTALDSENLGRGEEEKCASAPEPNKSL